MIHNTWVGIFTPKIMGYKKMIHNTWVGIFTPKIMEYKKNDPQYLSGNIYTKNNGI